MGTGRNRRVFLKSAVMAGAAGLAGGTVIGHDLAGARPVTASPGQVTGSPSLEEIFRKAGIRETAKNLGIDYDRVFGSLVGDPRHPYARYRWSVSFAADGGRLIQALPPEEEMGWAPWEEWLLQGGKPVRRGWVLFPVRETKRGVPGWWMLEQDREDLRPRFAREPKTLEELFNRVRVFEAATVVGFDARKVILEPLSEAAREVYRSVRWSVAPHRLAADLPVIQCLPDASRSDRIPWETWYTDGQTALIHHVHYTAPMACTGRDTWREQEGAPQRPTELVGRDWYYYNDPSMTPALAGITETIRK